MTNRNTNHASIFDRRVREGLKAKYMYSPVVTMTAEEYQAVRQREKNPAPACEANALPNGGPKR